MLSCYKRTPAKHWQLVFLQLLIGGVKIKGENCHCQVWVKGVDKLTLSPPSHGDYPHCY